MDEMPTTIGVTNEEGLNITVFLIAYPKPVIQWVFTSDIINATIDSTDDPFNVFEHVSNLHKANMTLTDFGNYTIFAFNGIGGMYKKTFIVIPQSKMLISNFIYFLKVHAIMNGELFFMFHSCKVNECFVENDFVHMHQRYIKNLILHFQLFIVML